MLVYAELMVGLRNTHVSDLPNFAKLQQLTIFAEVFLCLNICNYKEAPHGTNVNLLLRNIINKFLIAYLTVSENIINL